MFTGQSMQPEVICKRPGRAAVGCVLMESSTYLEVITPEGTLTGYSLCVTLVNVLCHFVLNQKTLEQISLLSEIMFQNSCILCCALQIYCLPLRAPVLVWEEMRDLKGPPPSCKDKLGCWVQKNRLVMTAFFLLDVAVKMNVFCADATSE